MIRRVARQQKAATGRSQIGSYWHGAASIFRASAVASRQACNGREESAVTQIPDATNAAWHLETTSWHTRPLVTLVLGVCARHAERARHESNANPALIP